MRARTRLRTSAPRPLLALTSARLLQSRERGSAIAEFVMVSALVLVLGIGVLQLALLLHVRNTLVSCASEGARLGARLGAAPDEGVGRTRDLIGRSLNPSYAQSVTQTTQTTSAGVRVVDVSVTAPLPVFGLLGPSGTLTVQGRAFLESQ